MQPSDITATELAYFDPGDGRRIAYRLRQPKAGAPTVLFLPGYASDMEGAKAVAIDAFCAARGAGDRGAAFGTLPRGLDLPAIVERATPKVG